MSAEKKKQKKVLGLVVGLVVVLFGGMLFVGAVSGWFDNSKIVLDEEYYCKDECDNQLMELTAQEYEQLVDSHKSFLILIDQGGCKTAEQLRGFMEDYAREKGVKVYRMMFEEMKKTPLHNNIKYYPSVAIISRGHLMQFLRADVDEDADKYNDYEAFSEWLEHIL